LFPIGTRFRNQSFHLKMAAFESLTTGRF